jgi:uncharacterized protein (TIGR02996 family)
MARKKSQEEAFLADIVEHPDDDTVRLIFADWLEEQGDGDRAEFIRVQIELEKLSPTHRDRSRLRRREQELWKKHSNEWKKEVQAWAQKKVAFERGFAAHISCTGRELMAGLKGVLARAPIRSVELQTFDDSHLRGLASHPGLARLRSLDLGYGTWTPAGLEVLCASPLLAGLRTLDVGMREAEGPHVAEVLASSPFLQQLTRLILRGGSLGERGGRFLASPTFANLSRLELYGTDLGSEGTAALAAAPWTGLTHLTLWANQVGDAGVIALANSPVAGHLQALYLGLNWSITDEGVRALANSSHLDGLTSLDLCHAYLGPAGARALAASPCLKSVTWLRLRQDRLSAEDVDAVKERFGKVEWVSFPGQVPH